MSEGYIDLKSYTVNLNDTTPMMQQYLKIKNNYPDVLLFYRMGDFYECFFEDAVSLSKLLNITLTKREAGTIGQVAMAGIPVKAATGYMEKLVKQGAKIAICEQLEDPMYAKGLVKRDVVKILTAGTLTEDNLLSATSNNYLCALNQDKKTGVFGIAYVDISTGEFKITECQEPYVMPELFRIGPSELIIPSIQGKVRLGQFSPDTIPVVPSYIIEAFNCTYQPIENFNSAQAEALVKTIFRLTSSDAFGFNAYPIAVKSVGALLSYISHTQKDMLPNLDVISPYNISNHTLIDPTTQKNLELVETLRDKNYTGSLLWAIDKTNTPMGARLLKQWVKQPIQSLDELHERQNAIEKFIQHPKQRVSLFEVLKGMNDIERLTGRISNSTASPRDLIAFKDSLKIFPAIQHTIEELAITSLNQLENFPKELLKLANIIEETIIDSPPVTIKEGGMVRDGYNSKLDEFRKLLTGGQEWLEQFESAERMRTGIKSLKVGFSKTFGYFIEISKSNLSAAPDNYVRKQTLTACERFINQELKEHENAYLQAETGVNNLEYEIFTELRDYCKQFVSLTRAYSRLIALLDVYISLASVAAAYNYVKPVLDHSKRLHIDEGRHPVIEQVLPFGKYVPNSIYLDNETEEVVILTGPNMAGKSTYMRQIALIIVLAQIGSFVPASFAHIGVVDQIFTRVGAVDDLSTGQSTFMVEMNETAYILNSATERSFILLDEVGRGTSTYDGVAIAWSVTEYITTFIKARMVFATHYHELNTLESVFPKVKNYRITVTENEGEIDFLHKVVPGGASKSYGIQVAKMAGLPKSVILKAEDLMEKMQKTDNASINVRRKNLPEVKIPQLSLFETL